MAWLTGCITPFADRNPTCWGFPSFDEPRRRIKTQRQAPIQSSMVGRADRVPLPARNAMAAAGDADWLLF
ncbi:hypothetical protein ARC272_21040 [Pantoea ananatis]|nr:hypothetical protein ARC272_21040 [Pantoea ananatis]